MGSTGAAAPTSASVDSCLESNSKGTRGSKDVRMDELRLSRSRASRPPVECRWRGELPFSMWDGMAEGFELGGDPEPMIDGTMFFEIIEISKSQNRSFLRVTFFLAANLATLTFFNPLTTPPPITVHPGDDMITLRGGVGDLMHHVFFSILFSWVFSIYISPF